MSIAVNCLIWPTERSRYFVDERGGCIAVRDRDNTDPEYSGLHSDTKGVVQYWHGTQTENVCPTCKHKSFGGWVVDKADRIEAHKLSDKLNRGKCYEVSKKVANPPDRG